MTSFGWKRKIGENVSKRVSTTFEENSANDEDEALLDGEVDWLHLVPKRRAIQLEDGVSKAKRLRDEGAILAGEERYWEALQKWDEALVFNSSDETIYEMKAQAYMQVGEVLPAIQDAKRAVFRNPRWWVAHQTLGRALMGVGEVKQALRSFCKAVRLEPSNTELWEEDVRWAQSLWMRRLAALQEKKRLREAAKAAKVVELDDDGFCTTVAPAGRQTTSRGERDTDEGGGVVVTTPQKKSPREGSAMPPNYVCLRSGLPQHRDVP